MDSKTQARTRVQAFHTVKMIAPGFNDLMAKFVNYHEENLVTFVLKIVFRFSINF